MLDRVDFEPGEMWATTGAHLLTHILHQYYVILQLGKNIHWSYENFVRILFINKFEKFEMCQI